MQFKIIKDGDSVRKHDFDVLKSLVSELKEGEENYIVLEPKTPIENSVFMQLSLHGGSYQLQLCFSVGNDSSQEYTKLYTNKEELYSDLEVYYNNAKLPNMKDWLQSASESEETEEVVKLYNTIDGQIYYFEVWLNGDDSLTIHYGELGEVGETDSIESQDGLPIQIEMSKFIAEAKEEGYAAVDDLDELVVQLPYTDNKTIQAKREQLESILSNSLGWTGNGHSEGSDMGNGLVNVFCYVVDKEIAFATLKTELEAEGLLRELKIAYHDDQLGKFILLYPEKGQFNL